MTLLFMQSDSRAAFRKIPMHLVSPSDGVTPDTNDNGGQPQISVGGAAYVNTNGTLAAIGSGLYVLTLSQAELATLGLFVIRFKSANCLEAQMDGQVVAFDPYSGPWQIVAGAGIPFTYTVWNNTPPNTPNTIPLPAVAVWVTTDSGGNNIILSSVTNAIGQVSFNVPVLAGTTVYFWQTKPGFNFTNPVPQVIG